MTTYLIKYDHSIANYVIIRSTGKGRHQRQTILGICPSYLYQQAGIRPDDSNYPRSYA